MIMSRLFGGKPVTGGDFWPAYTFIDKRNPTRNNVSTMANQRQI